MVSPGRIGAARALVAIEDGAFSDEALERHLVQKDRELGWFLCLGVLRRRAEVDAALRPFLRQPLGALDPGVRAVLRLGAFEKCFARTKPHAVVHQAVEVARKIGVGRASGLVNAVLRKVQEAPELSRAESLNLPGWLLERWEARFGAEATEAWARSACEAPPLMVVSTRDEVVERWREAGLAVSPGRAGAIEPAGAWKIEGLRGPVTALAGWEEGWVWVQDSAAVAMADLCQAGPGTRVLDACAAPGGKTLRLAAQGALVLAVDASEPRLARVQENLERTGLSAELAVHDWTGGPGADDQFDVVLVDAPCTALGTLRRSPEVKWRRQELDLAQAAARQLAILEATAAHVIPGGALVYAVCSPEPEEGAQVVARFCAEHPEFALERELATAPPVDGEDAHCGFRLVREAGEGTP